jgi:hypothetical protein
VGRPREGSRAEQTGCCEQEEEEEEQLLTFKDGNDVWTRGLSTVFIENKNGISRFVFAQVVPIQITSFGFDQFAVSFPST